MRVKKTSKERANACSQGTVVMEVVMAVAVPVAVV